MESGGSAKDKRLIFHFSFVIWHLSFRSSLNGAGIVASSLEPQWKM